MGVWKNLKNWLLETDPEESKDEGEISTNYLTASEIESFRKSFYGQLQEFEDDLEEVKVFMPEKIEALEHKISTLRTIMEETNSEEDISTIEFFTEIKVEYEAIMKRVEGLYVIEEIKKEISNMQKCFERVPFQEGGLTKEKLDDYKSWLKRIQDNVDDRDRIGSPLLENVDREKFNSLSMEAGYRIKLLDLMYQIETNPSDAQNPFERLSKEEMKRYSRFLQEDLREMDSQSERISRFKDDFNKFGSREDSSFFTRFEDLEKKLKDTIDNATMVRGITIRQVFDSTNKEIDSFDFLKKFVEYKILLNKLEVKIPEIFNQRIEESKKEEEKAQRELAEKEKLEKAKAEAIAKRQKEEVARLERIEKYRNLSKEEIEQEIYRIEHDITAKGSRYVNILDFQKEIAVAKGLLDRSQELQSNELAYITLDNSQLLQSLRDANLSGINYYVFPSCQEKANGKNLVVVSKSDEEVFHHKKVRFDSDIRDSLVEGSAWNLGTYPLDILSQILKKMEPHKGNSFWMNEIAVIPSKKEDGIYTLYITGDNVYRDSKLICREIIKKVKKDVAKRDDEIGSDIDMKDVMPFIEVPATKNIIPILEEFRGAKIDPYIEPNHTLQAGEDTTRNEARRDNIHIYFERKDLERVKALGIVRNYHVKYEDPNTFTDKYRNSIKWPEKFLETVDIEAER